MIHKFRSKPGRRTLAKRIRELARTDALAASLLAERGKIYSPIESLLNMFYHELAELKKIKAGEKTTEELVLTVGVGGWTEERIAEHRAEIPKAIQMWAFEISQILIDALVARNPAKIIEIAEAVKFITSRRDSVDPVRSAILFNKMLLIEKGESWEVRQWAQNIGWRESDKEYGYPQLRRLLSELEAPVKPSGQISRKRRLKNLDGRKFKTNKPKKLP